MELRRTLRVPVQERPAAVVCGRGPVWLWASSLLIAALLGWTHGVYGRVPAGEIVPWGPGSGGSGSSGIVDSRPLRKLDPLLRTVALTPPAFLPSLNSVLPIYAGEHGPAVGALIEGPVSATQIGRLGGVYRHRLGVATTVIVPVASLLRLAALDSLVWAEASVWQEPMLDTSVPASGVTSDVWEWEGFSDGLFLADEFYGYTGEGVIVGVIDTGIDVSHGDFLRKDGSSRILSVWDLETDIIWTPENYFQYSRSDIHGHGTHVAGIAAGNGRSNYEGLLPPSPKWVGVAPEADLLVVKAIELDPPVLTTFVATTNGVVEGLRWIAEEAAAREGGRPAVVNMSLGSQYGPHDGTSLYERQIDDLSLRFDVPVVVSAGNRRADRIHATTYMTDSPVQWEFVQRLVSPNTWMLKVATLTGG